MKTLTENKILELERAARVHILMTEKEAIANAWSSVIAAVHKDRGDKIAEINKELSFVLDATTMEELMSKVRHED